MDQHMSEDFNKVKGVDKEFGSQEKLMETDMKASIWMMKSMDLGYIDGQMAQFMKVNSKMI